MLKPIGPHAAAIYWRRRAILLFVVFVVLVLACSWFGSSGGHASSAGGPGGSPTPTAPSRSAAVAAAHTSPPTATATATATKPKRAGHTVAPPKPCVLSQLQISAASGATSYHVGDQPVVMLHVVDRGSAACVQDLADSKVELRVYNGESRVWGSHDCQIRPGSTPQTLTVGRTVVVSTTWSGLSSQPGCVGQRQRVGAGAYTVYALLDGQVGAAAQFSIT